MPRVNESEKRLLLVLGGVFFLAANVFGYLVISGMMKSIAAQKVQMNTRLKDLEKDRARAAEADERAAWMNQYFKAYPSEEFRETYLDGLVNSELTAGLEVDLSKPSVLPTDFSGEYCVRSRFRVNVKGPWKDVYTFIYRLQKPEEFRFVPRISMVPKKSELDDSVQLVEVQVEIEKWWPKPDGFVDQPENALAQNEQTGGDAVNVGGTPGTVPPAPAGETPAVSTAPAASPTDPASPSPAAEAAPATPTANNSTKTN
jgi:hypothetical protein